MCRPISSIFQQNRGTRYLIEGLNTSEPAFFRAPDPACGEEWTTLTLSKHSRFSKPALGCRSIDARTTPQGSRPPRPPAPSPSLLKPCLHHRPEGPVRRLEGPGYFLAVFLSSLAFFSSSSMIVLNASRDCAPTSLRPLMKNVGVPSAPAQVASVASAVIWASNFFESRAALNFDMSRPSSAAYFSNEARSSAS